MISLSDARRDMDDEAGARKPRLWCRTNAPRFACPPSPFFPFFLIRGHSTDPAQKSSSGSSFSQGDLRREPEACTSGPSWNLLRSHQGVRAASPRHSQSLRLIIVLTPEGRACVGGCGWRRKGRYFWQPRRRQVHRYADITYGILRSMLVPTQGEVPHKYFKSLLNCKKRSVSPGTAAEMPPPRRLRTSGGSAVASDVWVWGFADGYEKWDECPDMSTSRVPV